MSSLLAVLAKLAILAAKSTRRYRSTGKAAGWTYTLPKVRHRQGKAVEQKGKDGGPLRFCDQVSAHTMRRTAITTLLMLGVPEQVVRRVSGHAPGSREFYRYIALAEDFVQGHVRRAYEKLLEQEEAPAG